MRSARTLASLLLVAGPVSAQGLRFPNAVRSLFMGQKMTTEADSEQRYPIIGPEELMSEKAHGTSEKPAQENLRWGCSHEIADRIGNFNRHYAEYSGYWETTNFLSEVDQSSDNVETFYDAVTGVPLFRAPIGRSWDAFIKESKSHGWPSFRDEEVVWENVRCLRNGECVSTTGTHLGHNRKFPCARPWTGTCKRHALTLHYSSCSPSLPPRRCDEQCPIAAATATASTSPRWRATRSRQRRAGAAAANERVGVSRMKRFSAHARPSDHSLAGRRRWRSRPAPAPRQHLVVGYADSVLLCVPSQYKSSNQAYPVVPYRRVRPARNAERGMRKWGCFPRRGSRGTAVAAGSGRRANAEAIGAAGRCPIARAMRASSLRHLPRWIPRTAPLVRGLSGGVPADADVVVVGGGIIGTSTAYHLAKEGCRNVVLLERDTLTSGTTWHAAGLMVTFGSLSETSTEMRKYTKELYRSILPGETGMATGFSPVGFIEVASDRDRLEEYRRVAAFNRYCGVDVQELSPAEVRDKFPLAAVDDILAGFYVPTDGKVNPVDATMALARAARQRGVRIVEGCAVQEVLSEPLRGSGDQRRATGVRTARGDVRCGSVVLACGMWTRQLAQRSGAENVALQAMEHYYLLTEPMAEVDPQWPVLEDPERCAYIRPEGGGLMVGLFETDARAWSARGDVPGDFSFGELDADLERVAPFLDAAMDRVPASKAVGVKRLFCGPESFTPDGAPIVGESDRVNGLLFAAGLNSIGILSGGGIGRLVARWALHGKPSADDVTGVDATRFQRYQAAPRYVVERGEETLGNVYRCHYPNKQPKSARGVKRSPLHALLSERGAIWRDASGWEAPEAFLSSGEAPWRGEDLRREAAAFENRLTFGRPDTWSHWRREHLAVREHVALIDMSFMSKFEVLGPDAERLLGWLCTSDVSEAGRITYTQFLNGKGHIEADVTVARTGEESFLVVATDTQLGQVRSHLQRHQAAGDLRCVVLESSGKLAQLNVQGPLSRRLLEEATGEQLSDDAFPFRSARRVAVGFAEALCTRITYVGELGYELFLPAEMAAGAFETLAASYLSAGCATDEWPEVPVAGLRALGSLRMEKGYRDYGHDVDNTDGLLEAGLSFTADLGKDFLGKDAFLRQKEEGPRGRLLQVLLQDDQPMLHHGEVVYRDGVPVGDVRSASYGHTLSGAVGLAMVAREGGGKVSPAWLREGAWEVDVAGARVPATPSLKPLYDPKNERIKL